jgi:hypothetical protein
MTSTPARFCAHANAGGDASRCSCTALGPGPHTREQVLTYERVILQVAHARLG